MKNIKQESREAVAKKNKVIKEKAKSEKQILKLKERKYSLFLHINYGNIWVFTNKHFVNNISNWSIMTEEELIEQEIDEIEM